MRKSSARHARRLHGGPRQGKAHVAYPSALTCFAVKQYRCGRPGGPPVERERRFRPVSLTTPRSRSSWTAWTDRIGTPANGRRFCWKIVVPGTGGHGGLADRRPASGFLEGCGLRDRRLAQALANSILYQHAMRSTDTPLPVIAGQLPTSFPQQRYRVRILRGNPWWWTCHGGRRRVNVSGVCHARACPASRDPPRRSIFLQGPTTSGLTGPRRSTPIAASRG